MPGVLGLELGLEGQIEFSKVDRGVWSILGGRGPAPGCRRAVWDVIRGQSV